MWQLFVSYDVWIWLKSQPLHPGSPGVAKFGHIAQTFPGELPGVATSATQGWLIAAGG